jgi:hypothetical protein
MSVAVLPPNLLHRAARVALRRGATAMNRDQLDAEAVKKNVEPAFAHGYIASLPEEK